MRRIIGSILLVAAISWFAVPEPAHAQQTATRGSDTGFPLPRYVSIRNAPANLRLGPGENYKVDWALMHAGMPVQIIDEEGLWRQVRLYDGLTGWMHKSLLSGARTLLVSSDGRAALHDAASGEASIAAYAERGVILRAQECTIQWCRVRKGEIKGWISRRQVWGVGANETFN